jgi:glycosyltransferase involved in cell wall biosynthesis
MGVGFRPGFVRDAAVEVTGGACDTGQLRVAHLLAALRPNGAERMLQCSRQLWREYGIEPVVIGLSDEPYPFAPALRRAGYETMVVARKGRSLGGFGALCRTLADLKPDIVHVYNESMFPLVCALSRAMPGVRGVVRSILNNYDYRGLLAPRRVLFSRITAALRVVSVARGTEVADNEEHRYRHRPHVVEGWVDTTAFGADIRQRARAARTQLGLAPSDFAVMLLGNCEQAKGHALLLDAIPAVQQPVVVLHVWGEERADHAERTRWDRVAGHHRLLRLGRCDDTATLLAAADVLAMPSEHEGLGLAAAESFCAGTPVIASLAPGLGWVTDFRTGRAVPRSASAWAAELERAAARRGDPGWARACQLDAEDAVQRFSAARGVAQWRHIYELACSRACPGPTAVLPHDPAPGRSADSSISWEETDASATAAGH